jgi:hypothetical protein
VRPGRALALAAAWLAASGAPPAAARELVRTGEFSLDFTGSLRQFVTVGSGTDAENFQQTLLEEATRSAIVTPPGQPIACASAAVFAECPAFDLVGDKDVWSSSTRLRLRFDASLGSALSATVAYEQRLLAGVIDTFERDLGQALEPENLFDLTGTIASSENAEWQQQLYRGFVRAEGEHWEAIVGRQRIPWGVGRLWNPIDRLNAVGPLVVQPDEVIGVDSLDLKWRITGFTFLEGVYAPGPDSDLAAYALRLHGVWRNTDYSLVAGSFEEAWTAGFDLATNLRGAAVRAEAVFADPTREVWPIGQPAPARLDSFWQVSVGADYNFSIGNGLYSLVEHLYNGNALGFGAGRAGPLLDFFESTRVPPAAGLPPASGPWAQVADRAILGGSRVASGSRNQTGIQLSYDFTPSLGGDFLVIYDWSGSSAALFPMLRYTGFSDVEIRVGGQLFAGPRLSEFGSAKPFFFLQLDYFF